MLRHIGIAGQVRSLYGWREEQQRGRMIILLDALLTAVFNVFITGIFYTGFLTMYEIDLVSVGIITFIPPLASTFHMFSPMILERIRRRKPVLIAAKIYFYSMYIIATNLMPLVVTDPHQRVIWFCIILFLAYAVYSLFSDGFTPWFYNFYPSEPKDRAAFISYNQIFSSATSSAVLLLTGLLVTAVGSRQNTFILAFRYFAFVLVLVDVFSRHMLKNIHTRCVQNRSICVRSSHYQDSIRSLWPVCT